MAKKGSGYNTPRTFAVIVRNKVPSLLLPALRPELKQEKQLLERLSHRHWKAISMRVGIGGHLWPHALSWHEVALAIACQFPPTPGFPTPTPRPPLHQALLPGSFFFFCLLPLRTLLGPQCLGMLTINRKNKKNKQKTERNLFCPVSMAQSWRCAITLYCFPSKWNWLLILQGEKISLTLRCRFT